MRKAKEAGVSSFLIDRELNATGIAVAQIVSNNYQGATLGAQELVRLMGARSNVIAAIRRGEIRATVLQQAALIARTAVEQADLYLRTGSTGRPEKQSVDCLLVTPENADRFGVFDVLR